MRELVPSQVFDSLQAHLRSAGENAVTGWKGNEAEEDSLTGDLGRLLRTPRSVYIKVDGQFWRWRIDYKKFRGRGGGAFEQTSGADGIIQIEVTTRGITLFKGVLFQAKKSTRFRNAELEKQVIAMENLIPGGSAVLVYDPEGYAAIKGTEYVHSDEGLVGVKIRRMLPLASFFDEFLECKSGLRGMYYEAVRERLLFPTLNGEIRAIPLEVRNRIKIEIATS
jgi:hypothetical protein